MVVVVNHLHLNSPVDELLPSLEQEGISLISSQPGFRGFYFVRAAETHAIVILLWESAADADHAAKTFGPTWFHKISSHAWRASSSEAWAR